MAYVMWGAMLAGAVTLTVSWGAATWARGRLINYKVIKWAYRLFILHWVAIVVAPLCYMAGEFLFGSEAAGYVYNYRTLILWAALGIAAALFNCSIMAYALIGAYRSQTRNTPPSRADLRQFHLDDSCRRVFCAALLTYLLVLPEVYLVIFVTLFTGCTSCMWE